MAQGSKVRLKGVFRIGSGGACCAAIALMLAACPADAWSIEELCDLSLGELANVNIISVSKSNEALADAPAAMFVISRGDILHSGATSLPNKPLVLIDGRSVYSPFYSGVFWDMIGWRLTDRLQTSVSETNLPHDWHQELPPDVANQVPRSIPAGLKWHM
jgi:hypothetical protein